MLKKFRDWGIKYKLICGVSLIIFLLVIISGYALFAVSQILEQTDEIENNDVNAAKMSLKMNEVILRISPLFERVMVTKDPALLDDAEKTKQSFESLFSEHEYFSRNFPPALEALQALHRQFDIFYEIGRDMAQAGLDGKEPEARRLREVFISLKEELGKKSFELQNANNNFLISDFMNIRDISGRQKRVTVIFTLLAILLSIAIVFLLTKMIVVSLRELLSGTQRVANGDFSYQVTLRKKDEFGRLAEAFNAMTLNLRKITVSRDLLSEQIKIRMQTEDELRQQKVFVEKTIDALEYPLYVVDTDYNIVMVNTAGKKNGLYVNGRCYALTHKRDTPCAQEHACPLAEIMKTRKSTVMEHVHYDREGRERIMEVHSDPIFDDEGNVVLMIEYSIDATLRKRAEMEKERYLAKIESINRELDDFTYIVSHDLKEPLRSITAFSRFIADDYREKLDKDGQGYLECIELNAARMQQLIEDLLQISRIGRKRYAMEEMRSENIIKEAMLRLEYSIKEKGAQVNVKGELPVIFCDRIRLTEVFANLVSNAVKFADKQPAVIDIGCERKGIWYEFYVKDNGPGIEERYFEKVFKIFQRLEKRETHEGSGAGLAIVKKVVEMHKGRVWVTSELSKGTTFYFTIPAVKEYLLTDMDLEDSGRE